MSTEGGVRAACGPVAAVCDGATVCVDDTAEENDSTMAATPISGSATGQICNGDADYYRFTGSSGQRVQATLSGFSAAEGDLDLQLLNAAGAILDTSESPRDMEMVSSCAMDGPPLRTRLRTLRK